MSIVINVDNAVKIYKVGFWAKKVPVLNGVSFSIEKGQTFGLLGPNGAGKTSTLKLLVGLTHPTKGRISILGKSPSDVSIHRKIGFLPENPYIYTYLTGYEFLHFCGSFFGIGGKHLTTKVNELFDLVGLEKSAGKKQLKSYSKGMLQRIGIAQALINDPEIVFFDEPMSGLDPIGRYDVKEIMKYLKSQNKTIFFNTHILSDVEELCDKIAIMVKGKIVKEGTINELLAPIDNIYKLTVKGLNGLGKTNLKRASLKLLKTDSEDTVCATFNDTDSLIKGMAIAKQSGGTILEVKPYKLNLEDFFVDSVKKESGLTYHEG